MAKMLISQDGVMGLGSVESEEHLKPRQGCNINPPPSDGRCQCWGRPRTANMTNDDLLDKLLSMALSLMESNMVHGDTLWEIYTYLYDTLPIRECAPSLRREEERQILKENMPPRAKCQCGALEGQYHELFCQFETCPFCNGRLFDCDCVYEKLDFRNSDIDEDGLTDEQLDQWVKLLERKGRIPFIRYPHICPRCGEVDPVFFRVSGEDWKSYVEPNRRNSILCLRCYTHIKNWITLEGTKMRGNHRPRPRSVILDP